MAESVRILHVDDDSSFLELCAEFLAQEDDRFVIDTATSPDDGIELLENRSVDCVISDYQMPETDGIEFLESVRETNPELPFILFTGEGSETVASDAISAGATDYLQKQTGTEQYQLLTNRVINAVESYQTQRELRQYQRLVETVGDPMYILDADGEITLANEALAEMLGYERSTVRGMNVREFLDEADYEVGRNRLAEIHADPEMDWSTYEVEIRTADGRAIPTEINIAPVVGSDGTSEGSVGVVRDISDRRQREKRLEALQATTRELIDTESFETAVEIAIQAAEDVLSMELAAFFMPETDCPDRLVPVYTTEKATTVLGQSPTIERGDGLVWTVTESKDAIFADDVREREGVYNAETPIRSELLIPAGDHGVFVAAATTVNGFDTTDKKLAHVLVTTLTRALDSSRRQSTATDSDSDTTGVDEYSTNE